jgi:hypothetical protein
MQRGKNANGKNARMQKVKMQKGKNAETHRYIGHIEIRAGAD